MVEATVTTVATQERSSSWPGWLGLVGALICWCTTFYMMTRGSMLWNPLVEVSGVAVRPALLVAVVLGVVLFGLASRWWKSRFEWRKPGQGRWVRGCAAGSVLLLALYGARSLYYLRASGSYWSMPLVSTSLLGQNLSIIPMFFPAAGTFFLSSFFCYLLLNRPAWVEFLIETEGEMKKVSWPARAEFMGSSMVVILMTAGMAALLFLLDLAINSVRDFLV